MNGSCCAAGFSSLDLAQLAAFGLLMSAGHCLGMCGPLVCASALATGAPASTGAPGARAGDRVSRRVALLRSLAAYHGGRIGSYVLLGFAVGALSSLVPARDGALPAVAVVGQAVLAFLAAAALLWIGLSIFGVFPKASLRAVGFLSRWVHASAGGLRGTLRRLALGVANGFLPCGPVYTVAAAALAAGSGAEGALAMLAFGLGTLPLLVALSLGARWSAQWTNVRWRGVLARAAGMLAVAMGVQLLLRGLAALEWVPHARVHEVVLW